jgi:hypothetical protein
MRGTVLGIEVFSGYDSGPAMNDDVPLEKLLAVAGLLK